MHGLILNNRKQGKHYNKWKNLSHSELNLEYLIKFL